MAGTFELKKTESDQFMFNLKASKNIRPTTTISSVRVPRRRSRTSS